MLKLTDVDTLKMEMQSHFDVVEQDCSMSDEYREGVVAGLNASMFEIDLAPTIDAIPVEWLDDRANDITRAPLFRRYAQQLLDEWQQDQEGQAV